MDLKTGEIRAIVEPHRQSDDESLLSFEPLLIGSAVKPMIAAALLARQPKLAEMRLRVAGHRRTEVAGVPLGRPFHSANNGCSGGSLGIIDFLRCSSNQFAAELVIRSLVQNGYEDVPRRIRRATRSLEAVGRCQRTRAGVRCGSIRRPHIGSFGRIGVPPTRPSMGNAPIIQDQTLIPWESRPWLVFPKHESTPVDWIAR